MWEKLWEYQEELFTPFDMKGQEEFQKVLFQLLEDEIVKNPDIQSVGIDIFGSENKFFERYLSPHNGWTKDGIPEWVTKISILQNIQSLREDILMQWIEAFWTKQKLYGWLLRYDKYNPYWYKYKMIPLYFPLDTLINYIERIERWDF